MSLQLLPLGRIICYCASRFALGQKSDFWTQNLRSLRATNFSIKPWVITVLFKVSPHSIPHIILHYFLGINDPINHVGSVQSWRHEQWSTLHTGKSWSPRKQNGKALFFTFQHFSGSTYPIVYGWWPIYWVLMFLGLFSPVNLPSRGCF